MQMQDLVGLQVMVQVARFNPGAGGREGTGHAGTDVLQPAWSQSGSCLSQDRTRTSSTGETAGQAAEELKVHHSPTFH